MCVCVCHIMPHVHTCHMHTQYATCTHIMPHAHTIAQAGVPGIIIQYMSRSERHYWRCSALAVSIITGVLTSVQVPGTSSRLWMNSECLWCHPLVWPSNMYISCACGRSCIVYVGKAQYASLSLSYTLALCTPRSRS